MKKVTVIQLAFSGHLAFPFSKQKTLGDFRINLQTECNIDFSAPQEIQSLKIVTFIAFPLCSLRLCAENKLAVEK
jgi:hypothetical protein